MTLAESIYEDMVYILHHKEIEEKHRQCESLVPGMRYIRKPMRGIAFFEIVFLLNEKPIFLSNNSKVVMTSEPMRLFSGPNTKGIAISSRYIKEYFVSLEKCLRIHKDCLTLKNIEGILGEEEYFSRLPIIRPGGSFR